MMGYVTYDQNGNLIGSHLWPLHADHIGNFIEVSDEQRNNWTSYKATADRLSVELRPAPAFDLPAFKTKLVEKVDSHIAGIYAKWMRFEAEYVERESAARTFKAGGYTGDPGIWVTSFATYAGKTSQQAADLIIQQADGLRTALETLGALRMRKYSISGAADAAAAQSSHDYIISQANIIAAQLS